MTCNELSELWLLTEEYGYASADGAWLDEVPWSGIDVEWDAKCSAESGVMGYYSILRNRIGLMEVDVELIWPTYIHELWHASQWRKSPVRYLLFKLPFMRWKIENSAEAAAKRAEAWLLNKRTKR